MELVWACDKELNMRCKKSMGDDCQGEGGEGLREGFTDTWDLLTEECHTHTVAPDLLLPTATP